MDPCTELATRVVSYLWALRDLFPDARKVRDFDLRQLHDKVGTDMALLARLRSLARTHPNEQWINPAPRGLLGGHREKQPQGPSHEFQRLDLQLQAIVHERLYPADTTSPWYTYTRLSKGLKHYLGLNLGKPEEEDYQKLRARVLNDFVVQCENLILRFGELNVRTGDHDDRPGSPSTITRESLAEDVAERMLQGSLMRDTAIMLDYRPALLRVVDGGPELLEGETYPRALIELCRKENNAVPFQLVLHEELEEVGRSRKARLNISATRAEYGPVFRRAYERALVGLAFSGGGIRSATFNLGVLQGLSRRGWLPHVDYLSTVSGGGYIGSWLLAWIKRRGSVSAVQESLLGHQHDEMGPRNLDPGAEHVRPIRLLREYSNYLAPRLGAFSADTWTIVSIWVRNTIMNLLVLVLFLMAVLIAPRLLGVVFDGSDIFWSMGCLTLFLGLTSLLIGFNLRSFEDPAVMTQSDQDGWRWLMPRVRPSERGDTPFIVIATIVVPCLIAVFFAMRALWQFASATTPGTEQWATRSTMVFWWSFVLLFGGLLLTAICGRFWKEPTRGERLTDKSSVDRVTVNLLSFIPSLFWGAIAAAVGALLIRELWGRLLPLLFADSHRGMWIGIGLGPLVLLTVITVVIVIYLGLEGLGSPDERREWWSRLGVWLALIGGSWAALACLSFFAPYLVATTWLYVGTVSVGWGALTGVGAWLASSGESNGINLPLDKKPLPSLLITIAPYLFIVGLLVGVAVFTHVVFYVLNEESIPLVSRSFTAMGRLPFSVQRYADTYWAFVEPNSSAPLILCVSLLLVAFLLSWRADVNEFSMHHFYKNRLIRAYLGASRTRINRRPNAFTGLDMDDDIKLWRFTTDDESTPEDERTDCRAKFAGPFAIINTTLNMTTGDELAWQERKGQSFVFTPLYCGFDFATKQTVIAEKAAAQFAYRPTRTFANYTPGQSPVDTGIGIGTAVAISGAAANPNAGYHTSPAVAFLLTILNARLGWWIGNPLLDAWNRPSPRFGLFYMLSELFGFAGVKRRFVNLSDGGHFDNMGLYELVRRRCRFIIVCDGEQDDRYSFNGIAGAIRKCRVDFGVVIDLTTDPIRPRRHGEGESVDHIAVGKITYPGEGVGTIVYLKASLTGDEPSDVKEYRTRHKEFPHQTTADQFFDESQFESYRALGEHIADMSFPEWDSDPQSAEERSSTLEERVEALRLRRRKENNRDTDEQE